MINVIGLGYIGLPTALMFVKNGVKVFDSFVRTPIVDHQFMNFEDFVNEVEIVVIMTAHDHIKENINAIKGKIILDTKKILVLKNLIKYS